MQIVGVFLALVATAGAWTAMPTAPSLVAPKPGVSQQPLSASLKQQPTALTSRAEVVRMAVEEKTAKEEEAWTLDKVAKLGLAGVLSIAVAETVFWVLSFPTSELVYYVATGEWIDLLSQEGQLKFLAFTAGWGALGGAIAQYRTVLTAAALTPWMDRNVVQPYLSPFLEKFKKDEQ